MEILGAWNLANIVSSGALGVAANKVAGHLKYVTGKKGQVIYLIGGEPDADTHPEAGEPQHHAGQAAAR